MGLLTEGKPLPWPQTKALAEHVRQHGIQQFINHYNRLKDRKGDPLKWGDEIEYILIKFDDHEKIARVALKAHELLETLNAREETNPTGVKARWRPEFAAYMIEGTPGKPFGSFLSDVLMLESNMRHRRREVTELLKGDECIMMLTNFPRLGCPQFTYPIFRPQPNKPTSLTKSKYFPDEATFSAHPRFFTTTRNIRMRRGENVDIKVKIFRDKHTKLPVEGSPDNEPDVVHMDATGLGMGCGCLQITFQAFDMNEARNLYDQLAVMCPIMIAITAASPIYRGYLTETDCRWPVLSSSADCRTAEERGLRPLKENKFCIPKSRCDSVSSFISDKAEKYNDIYLPYHERDYQCLRQGGVDHFLAQHVAHLFVRDTIALFSEKVHQNDKIEVDHFEDIQSTNWQTMRFKPPPPNSNIGWRVEFRPCDVQITDFENAAIVTFIVLLTRVILTYNLDMLIPISKVDENMKTAEKRDACRRGAFWFRKDIGKSARAVGEYTNGINTSGTNKCQDFKNHQDSDCEYELMLVDEIFNGKSSTLPGLIPLIFKYLQSMDIDIYTYGVVEKYLRFIQRRASGELLTAAQWMREEVLKHPEYKQDSVVSDLLNYDLLKKIQEIQKNKTMEPILRTG